MRVRATTNRTFPEGKCARTTDEYVRRRVPKGRGDVRTRREYAYGDYVAYGVLGNFPKGNCHGVSRNLEPKAKSVAIEPSALGRGR